MNIFVFIIFAYFLNIFIFIILFVLKVYFYLDFIVVFIYFILFVLNARFLAITQGLDSNINPSRSLTCEASEITYYAMSITDDKYATWTEKSTSNKTCQYNILSQL